MSLCCGITSQLAQHAGRRPLLQWTIGVKSTSMRRSTPLSLPQPTRSARLTSFTLSFTPPGCLANSVDDDECEISHLAMPVGVAEDEDDEEDDSGGACRLRPCRLASRPHCWFGHSVKYSRTRSVTPAHAFWSTSWSSPVHFVRSVAEAASAEPEVNHQ